MVEAMKSPYKRHRLESGPSALEEFIECSVQTPSASLPRRSAPRIHPRRISENIMSSTPLSSRRSRPQLNGLRRTHSTGELQDTQDVNKKSEFRLPRDIMRTLKKWKSRDTKDESTHMVMDFGPPKHSKDSKDFRIGGRFRAQIRSSVLYVRTFVRSVFDR